MVIGIGGRKKSGKDTIAKYIKERIEYVNLDKQVKIYHFGDELKQFCMDYLDLTYEQCYGTEEQRNTFSEHQWKSFPTYNTLKLKYLSSFTKQPNEYMTGREVVQYWGTEIFRVVDKNYWVKKLAKTINKDNLDYAIIADVRFDTELEYCNKNGTCIGLTRGIDSDGHESETFDFAGHCPYVIDNKNLTLDETGKYVDNLCSKLKLY